MAASDPHPRSNPHTSGQLVCLGAGALTVRISEEINRAEYRVRLAEAVKAKALFYGALPPEALASFLQSRTHRS